MHGAVKLVLVIALLRGKLWAYPWMILVLLVFIGYQLFGIARAPTAGLIALTIFDIIVVVVVIHEYRHHTRLLRHEDSTEP